MSQSVCKKNRENEKQKALINILTSVPKVLVLDVVFGGQQAGLQPGQPDDCWYGQAILQISHSGELYIRYIGA